RSFSAPCSGEALSCAMPGCAHSCPGEVSLPSAGRSSPRHGAEMVSQPCHTTDSAMIRVVLPYHLRTLAHVGAEVTLDVAGAVTQRSILDALEARYPMLRGTIRDHVTQQRRPMLRFFACEEDLSHESPDAPLPEAVASGAEAFWVVGAIAGG